MGWFTYMNWRRRLQKLIRLLKLQGRVQKGSFAVACSDNAENTWKQTIHSHWSGWIHKDNRGGGFKKQSGYWKQPGMEQWEEIDAGRIGVTLTFFYLWHAQNFIVYETQLESTWLSVRFNLVFTNHISVYILANSGVCVNLVIAIERTNGCSNWSHTILY